MAINVRSVAQFAKLLTGKSTGAMGGKVGKNFVYYMKYGNQITKTVTRADGHVITGTFKQVGDKWRAVKTVQQNANGNIVTDLFPNGVRKISVSPASNPSFVAARYSVPYMNPVHTISNDCGRTYLETNRLAFDGLRRGILDYKG